MNVCLVWLHAASQQSCSGVCLFTIVVFICRRGQIRMQAEILHALTRDSILLYRKAAAPGA